MAGGLMQLVAYGAQDVYLTGNPSVTFFQAVYKKHTNFAMETIEQTVNGTANNTGRISTTIARNGDLVGEMYLEFPQKYTANAFTTAAGAVDTIWMAERCIQSVELTIGGQRIDKHYQRWWRLWSELNLDDAKKAEYGKMSSSCFDPRAAAATTASGGRAFLPLIFFFNRNPGLYLPLIALQYHEVRLDFDLSSVFDKYCDGTPKVWANYVYLDTEERRRFAQKGHEYLIEQVQHTGNDTVDGTQSSQQQIRLTYNHPVKELVWCYSNTSASVGNTNYLWNFCGPLESNVTLTVDPAALAGTEAGSNVYTQIQPHHSGAPHLLCSSNVEVTAYKPWAEEANVVTANTNFRTTAPLDNLKLILNGQDRFKAQSGKYFNQVQPHDHHSGTPYPGIYSYSFALKPEEHQPTGTCNFSRIDNAQVSTKMKSGIFGNTGAVQSMFAVNYNVLRIQSGMGGLAFSN